MSGSDDAIASQLGPMIAHQWSLATALSLLAWYVFAPQCLSTLAIIRRETGSWKIVAIATGYLFALAYAGRSEEHTSELQSLMRISYAVFCLKKKKNNTSPNNSITLIKTHKT